MPSSPSRGPRHPAPWTPPPGRRTGGGLSSSESITFNCDPAVAEWLRREAARTLGQIHKGRCVLKGRDVNLLYSLIHDLKARNPLAEAFQKHLDQRHAVALRRVAKIHDAAALQAIWEAAREEDDMPATLWALLTHPLGLALESEALYDARAWVFAQTRRSLVRARAKQQSESRVREAQQQTDDLRSRLLAQQRQAVQAMAQAQAEIARLNGELSRLQNTSRDATDPPGTACRTNFGDASPTPVAGSSRQGPSARAAESAARPEAAATTKPKATPIVVQGRRVLCVGGIQHAVARYRGRIENLGGRFEHHDGGLEDNLQALEGRLSRADVVICQAACINHEAYHRVKRHCERHGKPCLYLDRPSLSRFERAISAHCCE